MVRTLHIATGALLLSLACAATYELCSGSMLEQHNTALYQLR